tara:strand:+ start:1390 stop:2310 length:921 start_codon:yes stop_codon:yes gene_type:complete
MEKVLFHPDLKFVIAQYVDPQSRFYARIALRDKLGWIPKQVLAYVNNKRENGKLLKWNWKNLEKVVKEDKFMVVKWASTFNKYVKKFLCNVAAEYGKLYMLKWARKQQPPLLWDNHICLKAFRFGHYETLKWAVENACPCYEETKAHFLQYVSILENDDKWKNIVVNQIIYEDWTTLMMSCHFGHTELVRYLLGCDGINVNMEDGLERTSLLLACSTGKIEVVKLLFAHGDVNVNKRDRYLRTALHTACRYGQIEVVKKIISHPKCEVNKIDLHGMTAYNVAATEGYGEIAKLIKNHKLCIEERLV